MKKMAMLHAYPPTANYVWKPVDQVSPQVVNMQSPLQKVYSWAAEGTISNEFTKCEAVSVVEPTRTKGASETVDPTNDEDVSTQTVMMNREKGVTANQELTKGESNATAKNISPKRKEDATAENEPLKSPKIITKFLFPAVVKEVSTCM